MDGILPQIVQDGVTIFLGIVVQATPFILLGVVLSAILAHFVSEKVILKLFPKNRLGGILVASLVGSIFPVCECGNVPVARRLIKKGVHPATALTFLLAAPVMNPVVIFATWVAFSFMPGLVVLRVLFTLIIAWTVGIIFSFHPNPKELIAHGKDGDDHFHTVHPIKPFAFIQTIAREFSEMLAILSIGAFLATTIQMVLPREILLNLGGSTLMAILAMMLFAFIISVCANVDAFIALSYVNLFPASALLGFLVFGPMIDIKMLTLIQKVYSKKAMIFIVLLVTLLTVLLTYTAHIFLL
ncbi:MAG TPA: permease [Candidatus Gracilibacteria bacterium]|nr:permease [Candidatus Gracilibacteria bacterium]